MGLWLTVGKVALRVGVPALTKFARHRLLEKEGKAVREQRVLEDDQYFRKVVETVKREARERAKAAR